MFNTRRVSIVLACLILAMPIAARAQERAAPPMPVEEVSGGYLFEWHDHSEDAFQGWVSSLAYNVNNWFSVAGEISGAYDSDFFTNPATGAPFENKYQRYTYVAGPRFFYQQGRVVPYGEILIGAHQAHLVDSPDYEWNWAVQPGAGLTVLLNEHVGVRVGGSWQRVIFANEDRKAEDQLRFTSGFVFGWGER